VYILPPTNVQLTPLPSQRGVFISWELGESYYGLPYPNISFFLQIQYAVNQTEATPTLEVVGKVWWCQNINLFCFWVWVHYYNVKLYHHILSRPMWHCKISTVTATIQFRWAWT